MEAAKINTIRTMLLSSFALAARPLASARASGVRPSKVVAFTLAPLSMSVLMMALLPASAAL